MGKQARVLTAGVLAAMIAGAVLAQPAAAPPLNDTRVAVSTLVREDMFAGFLEGDMASLARGEANLDKLYESRPAERADIRSWQAGGLMYRAVLAREAGRAADYTSLYAQAITAMDEADALKSTSGAVPAVGGGIGVLFADRLAPADRTAYWERSYRYYQAITTGQAPVADKLPVHIRGESYAGLVTAAQRAGHTAEAGVALDRMLVLVKGTPYEADALKWKADPSKAATMNLGCKSCHDDGRLAPTLQRLSAAAAAAAPKTP